MSFYQKKGKTDLTGIEEIVISTVGGDFELEGVQEPVSEMSWDVIWEKEDCDVEVVRIDQKLIIRFDDKSNIVKFFGITINTSVGSLYKAKIYLPVDTLKKISISTVSGSIKTSKIKGELLNLSSTSGDIQCDDTQCDELTISTKSGDLKAQKIQAKSNCNFSSLSGDISSFDVDVNQLICSDKSGDIKIDHISPTVQYLSVNNVSGDVAVRNLPTLSKIVTVSGDIMIKNINPKVSWNTHTVSGDINILTTPVDANVSFVSVSGDAFFKQRQPTNKGKNEFIFGNGAGGQINAKTVSGDLIFKTDESATQTTTEKIPEEKTSKHDPDAERIVYTYLQGIITLEEAKEMLTILEYDEEHINLLIEQMRAEVNEQNHHTHKDTNSQSERTVVEDEEKSL
ncbi:MAG TPA: DUF4097 family beta strand repeat-containing protein [Thermotogota bacterium]|nr:DUF4097 family beta strand repeat-containing protein [Thermotogota bacterium]HRW33860.1 DUF4097 family beta strand repeat-containing protein [Thermotogota bacterium]